MLVVEPGPGARERLQIALDHCRASAVLIRPRPEHNLSAGEVKPLVDLAQQQGAAAIVFDDVKLAKTVRADGVHLLSGADLTQRIGDARIVLGMETSIGVEPGLSRHYAMEAGEAGADYIAFGVSDPSDDGRKRRDDLVTWWAEIFEIPCVVLDVETAGEAEQSNRDGADFVALSLPSSLSLDAVAERAGAVDAALFDGNASLS